jgi:hypothetical protein
LSARAPVVDAVPQILEFTERHAVVLRSFLGRDEREWVKRQLAEAVFEDHTIEATGKTEMLMKPNGLSAFLLFKMCDPEMLDRIEALTGTTPGDFRGRTYRMLPGGTHFSPWHDDAVQDRIAACSVNLSPEPFEGATLQIKSAEDDELVTEIGDLSFGDAVLIQISRDYQHRNSPLVGTAPKTSYAGFFYPWDPSPLARRTS